LPWSYPSSGSTILGLKLSRTYKVLDTLLDHALAVCIPHYISNGQADCCYVSAASRNKPTAPQSREENREEDQVEEEEDESVTEAARE